MPRPTQIDRAIAQLDDEIAVLMKAKERLIAQREADRQQKAGKA